ncbi:hypothetical protein PHMEG_00029933 [Phytophthora megakarya]|uniref:Uncharacterized protein n=1 Tax=Phytophthora megakarya TaxID=4795 RepID=A0A225V003_9STRA|nr:hypothetical protein PHMEG_00029933 [Phytophthora megakarya]
MECCLGMIEHPVPPNGNCQVFAVTQLLLEEKFGEEPAKMTALASTLKIGVQYVAQLNIVKDFTFAAKQAILQRVKPSRRVTKANAGKLLAKLFEAYAESPTDATTIIPEELWGSNDTLRAVNSSIFTLFNHSNVF